MTLVNNSSFKVQGETVATSAGADPSALNEYASDLDVHVEIDTPGSRQEYVK